VEPFSGEDLKTDHWPLVVGLWPLAFSFWQSADPDLSQCNELMRLGGCDLVAVGLVEGLWQTAKRMERKQLGGKRAFTTA
jgi:hypothetical protein